MRILGFAAVAVVGGLVAACGAAPTGEGESAGQQASASSVPTTGTTANQNGTATSTGSQPVNPCPTKAIVSGAVISKVWGICPTIHLADGTTDSGEDGNAFFASPPGPASFDYVDYMSASEAALVRTGNFCVYLGTDEYGPGVQQFSSFVDVEPLCLVENHIGSGSSTCVGCGGTRPVTPPR